VWFDKHILWYDVKNGENRHRLLAPDVNDVVYPGSKCVYKWLSAAAGSC
jgi:hypothetical protein